MPQLHNDKAKYLKHWKVALRVVLSVIIVVFLAFQLKWESLQSVLTEMNLGLVLLAFVIIQVGQSFSSLRWLILARIAGFQSSYHRFRTLFYVGTFFNLFLPTSIGGDAVRAWKLAANKKERPAAFGTVIADRLAGVTVMLIMACLATINSLNAIDTWIILLPWALLAGIIATLVVLPRLSVRSEKYLAIVQNLTWSAHKTSPWSQALGLAFIVQCMATWQVILLGQALGLATPWYAYFVVVPLVTLLTMLPVSFNGIGVREGGLILLFAPYGVSKEQALALGVAWFALSVGVGLVGGVFYLFFDRHEVSATDRTLVEEGKDSHESLDRGSNEGRERQRRAAA